MPPPTAAEPLRRPRRREPRRGRLPVAPLGERAHQPDAQSRRDLVLDRGPPARRARRRRASRARPRRRSASPALESETSTELAVGAGVLASSAEPRATAGDRGGPQRGRRPASCARSSAVWSCSDPTGAARGGDPRSSAARPGWRRRAVPAEGVSPRGAWRRSGSGVRFGDADVAGRRRSIGRAASSPPVRGVDRRRGCAATMRSVRSRRSKPACVADISGAWETAIRAWPHRAMPTRRRISSCWRCSARPKSTKSSTPRFDVPRCSGRRSGRSVTSAPSARPTSCLAGMKHEPLARACGEAYCWITGADLERDGLARRRAPPDVPAFEDDDLDANLVPAPEELWPLPDADAVRDALAGTTRRHSRRTCGTSTASRRDARRAAGDGRDRPDAAAARPGARAAGQDARAIRRRDARVHARVSAR